MKTKRLFTDLESRVLGENECSDRECIGGKRHW